MTDACCPRFALSLRCADCWDDARSTGAGWGVGKEKPWTDHLLSKAFHLWEIGWGWILLEMALSKQVDSRLAIIILYCLCQTSSLTFFLICLHFGVECSLAWRRWSW